MENEEAAATKTDEDDARLMETLRINLSELEENTKKLVKPIEQLRSDDERVDELALELSKLQENVRVTLDPFWQRIKNEMFDAKCCIKAKDEELRKLRSVFENQELELSKVKSELKDVRTVLFRQSSYTASLGATLCSLLWKASKEESVVLELLKGRKIFDFLRMVCDSVQSFFDAFGQELPSVQSREGQFILSITGVIANIAAVPEGRQFLVELAEAEDVIRALLKIVPKISPSGVYIQRMVLMVLFNVSLEKRGNNVIESDKYLLSVLMKNITEPKGELRSISLRLLQSLAFDVENIDFLVSLIKAIKSAGLEEVQQYCPEDDKAMLIQIIDYVEFARQRLQNGENKIQNGF